MLGGVKTATLGPHASAGDSVKMTDIIEMQPPACPELPRRTDGFACLRFLPLRTMRGGGDDEECGCAGGLDE